MARRKLTQINRVGDIRELAVPPGNRLERLRGDRAGQYSIRINNRYRICFPWEQSYADNRETRSARHSRTTLATVSAAHSSRRNAA